MEQIHRETNGPPDIQDHLWPRQTRKNPARNGQRTDVINTMRHGEAERGILRIIRPIIEQLPVGSRMPPPTSDAELLGTPERSPVEYFQAVEIGGSGKSQGKGRIWRFITENREIANYAALDYKRRLDFVDARTEKSTGH